MRMWLRVVLPLIALGTAGCGSSSMPGSTVGPTIVAAPSVASISPQIGSTGGSTGVKIEGTNLGTIVTFDGVPVQGRYFSGNPTLYLATPPHAAGMVDVVVIGQGGRPVTLTAAYTYASPLTFDF